MLCYLSIVKLLGFMKPFVVELDALDVAVRAMLLK